MINKFKPIPGASGYQLSNPSVIDVISVYSLEIYGKTDMATLMSRSNLLTRYLKKLLLDLPSYLEIFHIITPELSGSQLSLYFRNEKMQNVFDRLKDHKITVDARRLDVIRVAPTALYNTFEELRLFVEALGNILENILNVTTIQSR
ncbi:Kynureninase [Neolecta irregularis DAH-3]|uniref:Kynureninase n=1 Tax=Neolecta irregularis (strain DAH-3) TaxID=1198029 RepID=A0A1U7LVF5_NEOID|nr:Kynureninase [Neolecta irregularis DAH-3]|eukprot:OLL26624.1 Kynureninase [Neolecta irregularis DAH-3]